MAGSRHCAASRLPALARGAAARDWRRTTQVGLYLTLIGACACAATRRPDPADLRPLPATPGAGLAGTRVIVLPLSVIRNGDTFGWAASIPDSRAYLVDFNAQMDHALTDRAPRTTWVFPPEIARQASRNPGYLADPYRTDASQFGPDRWRAGGKLDDPLAGDLRTYTSFVDARIAFIPVELRFFPRPAASTRAESPAQRRMMHDDSLSHMGRAVLRVAVVDSRTMNVIWVSDVVGDPARALTPAVTANLVDRLAQALSAQ